MMRNTHGAWRVKKEGHLDLANRPPIHACRDPTIIPEPVHEYHKSFQLIRGIDGVASLVVRQLEVSTRPQPQA